MTFKSATRAGWLALAAIALSSGAAVAQGAGAAPVADKGDTAWMMVSTVLVLLMIVPGLALFYGGLIRAKNMLSVLTQILAVACISMLLWVIYGYSLAFTGGSAVLGDFSKTFLLSVTKDTVNDGGTIPEYVFFAFQMTFAAITPTLAIGAFVERVKFSAVLLFALLWITLVYYPLAHMVWQSDGYLFKLGALDFAGGTVVHVNAGIAGLVGALIAGKRVGYGREVMAPHSLTLTFTGAALLWVGWFGFNAGSALAANGVAALALVNTLLATAAAALGWMLVEWMAKGKPSLLGTVSGVIAGLVAITPAAGLVGPIGGIVLGIAGGVVSFFFCTTVKNAFGYDDSADVFGVHGVAGIVGSIGTGIFVSSTLGGVGVENYDMASQLATQCAAVAIAVVWCGVISAAIFKAIDLTIGLRVPVDAEREGLDITDHGERAYNM
ncbi:Ammonium transporter OS=Afipia felis OX=1035 GN=amtB PE=3 SV=1 [Afipia felis]